MGCFNEICRLSCITNTPAATLPSLDSRVKRVKKVPVHLKDYELDKK
ncbi:hypothetical protein CCACVL1_29318 [Corchorus capsularis]|uniref:Uncharacterized protein n=1 Tax=Corchorus capsularis TaxID=210143 RepID=A0A1R3G2D8_COCAP|nr:hypothetical protein CCACVL1_29318 [Corchorus capsularis]